MFDVSRQRHGGVTLIEMLMAMLITSIVIASLYSFILASHYQLDKQVQLARQNDYGMAVRRLFQSEIKQAGQIGCMRLNEGLVIPFNQYSITPQNKLQGSGMSKLTVRYVKFPTASVISPTTTSIIVDRGDRFNNKDILVITDCQHGEIFQVNYVVHGSQQQTISTTMPLHYRYHPGAEVGKLVINQIYMQNGSLYLKDIHNHSTEVVSQMTGLKMRFAIIENDNLVEMLAKDVLDWAKVKGVAVDIPPNRHLFVALA